MKLMKSLGVEGRSVGVRAGICARVGVCVSLWWWEGWRGEKSLEKHLMTKKALIKESDMMINATV